MRPHKHVVWMLIAKSLAERSTCVRRKVGCVLVDSKGYPLSMGYNGAPQGLPHCNEGYPCEGANDPSGKRSGECLAVHAEQNALIRCPNPEAVHTIYITLSPCMHCIKMLLNTNAENIIVNEEWHETEKQKLLWKNQGRRWICLTDYSFE